MADYHAYASVCVIALQTWYNSTTGLWDSTGWWNSANALEALVDYCIITRTTKYNAVIANTFAKNKDKASPNFLQGHFCGQYYDDQLWWGLAWLRAYELTHKQEYLDASLFIFNDTTYAWDTTCGGGIWWNRTHTYKNAITNELFMTLAARLSSYRPSLLSWLNRAWNWFEGTGMIDPRSLVHDGIDFQTCQPLLTSPTWTYNQGVILGVPNADRFTLANAAITTLVNEQGILIEPCEANNSCGNDGPQFKGIFMRYLGRLYVDTIKNSYRDFILRQADSLWANNRTADNKFGLHWSGPIDSTDAARQTSALDTFNAAMLAISRHRYFTRVYYTQ